MTNMFPHQHQTDSARWGIAKGGAPQARHFNGVAVNLKAFKILSLFLGFLFLTVGPKPAAGDVSEYAVKAAYLYNFTQFVRWPEGAMGDASPFVIGILGDDPFGEALDGAVQGKTSGGHPLQVKRLGAFNPGMGPKLAKCQVLFISYSEKDQVKEILQALKGASILTVSEIEQFPVKGGAIQFDQEGQKITITLNETAVKKAGLSVSSQLLQVAKLYQAEE
jgi:hypothetical protein